MQRQRLIRLGYAGSLVIGTLWSAIAQRDAVVHSPLPADLEQLPRASEVMRLNLPGAE